MARFDLKAVLVGTVIFMIVSLGISQAAEKLQTNQLSSKVNQHSSQTAQRQIIIVVADRLSIADFNNAALPNLQRLANIGAIGLMNTNTAGPRIPDNTYAAIGAGARIQTNPVGGEAFTSQETLQQVAERDIREDYFNVTAGELYRRRTGLTPKPGEIVHLQMAKILRLNAEQKYPNRPGALGQALHEAGLKTAVIGNADTDVPLHGRQAALIAMDQYGRVDTGLVDHNIIKKDAKSIWGFSTNYQALWQAYLKYRRQADLLVIELGDTARVEAGTTQVFDRVAMKQRQQALRATDDFLGRLLGDLNLEEQLLVVISPTPSELAQEAKFLLTPVVLLSKEHQTGLLTSSTTKRPGFITNIDLAPSLLRYFSLSKPAVMLGQPITNIPYRQATTYLQAVELSVNFTYLARPTLVKGYVFMQIIGVILAMSTIFWGKPQPEYMKKFLLGLMAVPLSLLLLPVFGLDNLITAVGLTLVLTAIFVALGLWLGKNHELDAFIIICLGSVVAILGDALSGSLLIKNSTLGYDPMVGARFYGIGNEYMGVLLGAITIGTTALLQRWQHHRKLLLILIGILYVITTCILAAPNLGTNLGGTIAAIGGLGFTYLWLTGRYPNIKTTLLLVLVTVLIVGAFLAYDLARPVDSQSHLGRFASLVMQNGLPELINVIQRKLAINIKLIVNITIWARVLLVSIVALGILFYRPVGVMQILRQKYPSLYIGFVGVIVGSLVALTFNDSGIVAAATMMIYCSAPLIYLVIQEQVAIRS